MGATRLVVREDARELVHAALREAGSIYAYASRLPTAEAWQGRRTLYSIPATSGERWVVRRLHHGGLLAAWTGRRFIRCGRPRPFNELLLASRLAACGIATPQVAAACVYPSGLTYGGEVARVEVPEACDLAACLFGGRALVGAARTDALIAAGRLVGQLHGAGVIHPDLNLRNILIAHPGRQARAWIIDLEKCRVARRVSGGRRARMLARLGRSAERWGEISGQRLADEDWRCFHEGYSGTIG